MLTTDITRVPIRRRARLALVSGDRITVEATMPNVWQALNRGESARERKLQLERAHERFLVDLARETEEETRARLVRELGIRPVVMDSWLRAKGLTLDPERMPGASAVFSTEELSQLRARHPIARAVPVVQRLLLEEAAESGFIVALGDAEGRLLWVDGERGLRRRAEDMGFAAGTDWSETAVGTSAPGSALVLDHAIQVMGAEHYNVQVHEWSCTAAPVHDPTSGAILGVLDVTGGDEAAAPHIMPLLQATLAAVEAEIRLDSLRTRIESDRAAQTKRSPQRSPLKVVPRLIVLGRNSALLQVGALSETLSGRHAEILLALARAPKGLSSALLAEQVYGDPAAEGTLRPEVVRLRKALESAGVALGIDSRPYRLTGELKIDAGEMLRALERGAHRVALAAYEGPVLPGSDAPIVEALRDEVDATLRQAMMQSAAHEVLYDYALQWAEDDEEVWETLLQVLPPLSPKRSRVVAKLEQLGG